MSPIWLMLLSTLCLSFSSFFAKLLADVVVLNLLLLARLGIPAAIMLLFSHYQKARFPTFTELKILLSRAVFIALAQLCFFIGLTQLSLIEIAVLFSTGPLFIPLIERLLYGKHISLFIAFILCVSFFGVLIQSQILSGVEFRWALLIGVLSGFFNACSQVSMYNASKIKLKATMINGMTFLLALGICLPLIVFFPLPEQGASEGVLLNNTSLFVGLTLLMGTLSVGTQLFRTKAYKKAASTAELAPIFYLNLAIAAVLQVVFFDDVFTQMQIVGLLLISAACLFYTLNKVVTLRQSKP
ncbi:DMT family transporter [Marinomonas agarivorans]|nr:DMT family transporter [Marinomonas agarivorans]